MSDQLVKFDPAPVDPSPPVAAPRTGPGWFQYLLIASLLIAASNYDLEAGKHGGFSGDEWNENKRESIGQIGEGGPLRGVALALIGVVSLVYFARPTRYQKQPSRWPVWSMVAFGGVAIASVSWSDDPLVSVKRVGAVCIAMLLAAALARHWNWAEVMRLVVLTAGLVTFGGLLISLPLGDFRPWAPDFRFAPMSHPNPTAQDCAMLVMAAAGLAIAGPRRRMFLVICAVGGLLMFMTRSRTAVLSFAVAAFVAALFGRPKRELAFGLLLAGIMVAAIVTFVPDIRATLTGAVAMGRQDVQSADVGTLTGRTYIWEVAYGFFKARPLQGYGFGGFWIPQRIDIFAAELGWVFFHAHSGYVDAALGMGIIGLFLYVLVLASSWFASMQQWLGSRNPGALFGLALITFMAVCSFAETFFPAANLPSFFALMVIARLGYSEVPVESTESEAAILRSEWRPRAPVGGAQPAGESPVGVWSSRP